MRLRARLASLGLLLPLLLAAPAGSQFLYLDANGNGIRDPDDRLAETGPTVVDVWLVTDRNRDGTPVTCDDAGFGMTLNSYSFVLRAVGGTVKWGPMQNRLPFSTDRPASFASYADTTDAGLYHNGWGYSDYFPPGIYRLATLTIERQEGNPSIFVEPYHPDRPVLLTQFGTKCPARDQDNTYKLGLDWSDASGLGSDVADAGGPYFGKAGRTVTLRAKSRSADGSAMTHHWDFGDGTTGDGVEVTHIYASPGDYRAVLTTTSTVGTATDEAEVHVVEPAAPIAQVGGPYYVYKGYPLALDGRRSYDPDGYPITDFEWDFGDGTTGRGPVINHVYTTEGTFTLRLSVSNGLLGDSQTTTVKVRPVPHAPVAEAGGPYSGIVGRTVMFSAAASYDSDGDPLDFQWQFGDGGKGYGVVVGHAYTAPGQYGVALSVKDGYLGSTDYTTCAVTAALAARAFSENAVFEPGDPEPILVRIEPVDGAFRPDEVEPWILMRSSGTGLLDEIPAVSVSETFGDSDGNGVHELEATFAPEDLTLLLGQLDSNRPVTVTLGGSFFQGGSFAAELTIQAGPSRQAVVGLRVSPNPFNPAAVVSFSISRPGAVRAQLYDVRGRVVRTVLDEPFMSAGRHSVALDSDGGAGGARLASGIYFLRLSAPDGISTRRVAVAK